LHHTSGHSSEVLVLRLLPQQLPVWPAS